VIENFDGLKKQLSDLAPVINGFKSEAVQLRLLEFVLGEGAASGKSDRTEDDKGSQKSERKRRRLTTKKASPETSGKRKIAPSGAGAVAALTDLLSGPFFSKPRTINDIVQECKLNRARTFKPNEFSGKLARLVRTGALTREKNADKQYQYKKS
jgi:hypothetical protein